MKAVMAQVPQSVLDERRRTSAHRWDEMWDGVWHMPPLPNRVQQDLEAELETWLRIHWGRPRGNKVYHQFNLASEGGWPNKNFRVPDLVLLTPEQFHIDHNEYFEGAPTVAVEIRSRDDETYEKLPFYAELGVPEVWVIDRDTRRPEIHVLRAGGYELQPAGTDGWLQSAATAIELRAADECKLSLRVVGDEGTLETLPAAD